MSKLVFRNNATDELDNNLVNGPNYSATDVEFWLVGTGDNFPPASIAVKEEFYVTLNSVGGQVEVCICTDRTGNKLTLTRGQDRTTALTWSPGDRVEMRPVAGSMERVLQNKDDKLAGALDADDQDITSPAIRGGSSYGMAVRAPNGLAANELIVPDNTDPSIGGYAIWTKNPNSHPEDDQRYYNVPGTIVMFNGDIAPPGWAMCDGQYPSGGGVKATPDLRAKFIMGWNYGDGSYPSVTPAPDPSIDILGSGGNFTRTVTSVNNHNHGLVTGGTAITEAQMPSHKHDIAVNSGESSDGKVGVGQGERDHTYDTLSTGGGLPHDHGIADDGAHTHTLDDSQLIPYVVLAFMIKLNVDNQVP
jgi:microcystin-dependent protein